MMDLMWLFTVPVLKLAIKIAVGLGATFLFVQVLTRVPDPHHFWKLNPEPLKGRWKREIMGVRKEPNVR
jgi:hypothetical protein